MKSAPALRPLPLFDTTSLTPPMMQPRVSIPSTHPGLRHLKLVSKANLEILRNYLPAWAKILGSANGQMCHADCFAGPGRYMTRAGEVDGSAVIAVRMAQEYCDTHATARMQAILMEKDADTVREDSVRGVL